MAWAVDAACSGNPGPMEYRAIDLQTGSEVFHFGPTHGTNNIGEFLAIVHALALLDKQHDTERVVYSDSYNAILWVHNKKCKTKLARNPQTEGLYQIVERAEKWLQTHPVTTPILKWETKKWGEVPADFGRKKSAIAPPLQSQPLAGAAPLSSLLMDFLSNIHLIYPLTCKQPFNTSSPKWQDRACVCCSLPSVCSPLVVHKRRKKPFNPPLTTSNVWPSLTPILP